MVSCKSCLPPPSSTTRSMKGSSYQGENRYVPRTYWKRVWVEAIRKERNLGVRAGRCQGWVGKLLRRWNPPSLALPPHGACERAYWLEVWNGTNVSSTTIKKYWKTDRKETRTREIWGYTEFVKGNLFPGGIKRILNTIREKKTTKNLFSNMHLKPHVGSDENRNFCPFQRVILLSLAQKCTESGAGEFRGPRVNLDKRYDSGM